MSRTPVRLAFRALEQEGLLEKAGKRGYVVRRFSEADVRSAIDWDQYGTNSWWIASAIFAPTNRAKVEAAFKEEVERALKDGFTAKELEEGKQGLLNFRNLSRAQDRNVAGAWVRNLDLGRTFAFSATVDAQLKALTLAQVNAALRKYIEPAKFVVGFAGDFKEP